MSDQLPSIDDFAEDLSKLPSSDEFVKKDLPHVEEFVEDLSKLPSADDFIKEDLPSVEEFIEEEEIIEEQIQTLFEKVREEDKIEESVSEETAADLTEILHLIDAVRRDIPEIPEIPEIKYYDEELEKLTEYIGQVYDCIPEVKNYDAEVESICEQIDLVKEEIKDLPEVKYYDTEVEAICEQIDKVRSEIPDLSWVGETFNSIDSNFGNVNDHLEDIKVKFNKDIDRLTEDLDIKHFEKKVDIKGVKDNLQEVKDKVYEELKETASRIWDHHNEFKDDDRKLKKQILSQYNKLSQNIEKQITETKNDQKESANILKDYFEGLKDEISNLPEVKYYDNSIDDLKKDLSKLDKKIDTKDLNISELYKIVGELKEKQGILKEEINNRPVTPDPLEKQGNDPLTPTDQKFATLKDLAEHYRLFVNRVQQQLYTIGGGGAVRLNDLDDVNIDGLVDGNGLLWNASTSKWDVGTVGAGGTWATDSVGISTIKNVGIATTARSDSALYVEGNATVTGNLNVTGDIVYDEVSGRNLDISGIATVVTLGVSAATTSKDLLVTGVSTFTGIGTFGSNLFVDGDTNIGSAITIYASSGIVSATTFYGSGSGLTGVASTDNIITSTASTMASIYSTGIITATTFSGNLPTTDLTGTITNAQLAGSIANAKLSNDSVSFGGVSLDLGGTDATPAFDLSDATAYPYTSLTGITTEIVGDTTPQLGGNLDINSKYITGTGGVNVTGVVTATSFVGNVTGNASGTAGGLSGTPDITVNNIIAVGATFSGAITYEDVTNIDSVGIVTAGKGVRVTTGGLVVTAGVSTFSGIGTFGGDVYVDGNLNVTGDIVYDEVSGRNLDISGIATVVTLGVSAATTSKDLLVTGITTLGSNNGIGTVYVGSGTTALMVDGDARVIGILTVGRGSVTIDGENNQVSVGLVTVTNSTIIIGENVTIDASATGINSAPNVLYVAKDGVDTNNGTSIDNAFLTIKAAVGAASSGTTVKILSGKYTESNPIEVPAFVSIVGDDQRTVQVTPSTTTSDIFHVRKGSKLSNMTFKDHEAPAAAVAFPTTEIAENVGGGKWKGPYIQNCTSDTTTGKGIYIDGNQARLLKAMNIDSYTQYNQGGVGVAVTNGGFAQLVSLFTICCNEAVTVDKGGQADIANSNCSFGTYGLIARGVSELQYSGIVTSSAAVSQATAEINISTPTKTISGFNYHEPSGVATVTTSAAHGFAVGMGVTLSGIGLTCTYGSKTYPYQKPFIFNVDSVPSTTSFVINVGISTVAHTYVSGGTVKIEVDRPYDGQLCYFDTLYKTVKTITVGSGGTGYSLTPTVTVASPGGPSGENATAYATLDGESVSTITIISSGSQYESTPDITISGPDSGINTATATASMSDIYYTINSSTPVTAGVTTVTLSSNLLNTVGVGSTAYFYQGSRIVASSHTFEYVGAGNNIADATPKRGGVTVQANEVVTESGGLVLYTSTDQAGNFRIGDDLKINQETGTISGRAFSKSLFSEMTPFILALS